MTEATDPEPVDNRPTFMPILIALGIVGILLIAMMVFGMIGGNRVSDEAAVGRAVVAQNDALQRENYGDFRTYTCGAEQGVGEEVVAAQRRSKDARGARFVDDVTDVAVNGDKATATVVYHFEKTAEDKIKTPMSFAREDGGWKVCSAGPR